MHDEKRRATLEVTIDLDGVPGFGHDAMSWATILQDMLDRSVEHYRPRVTITDEGGWPRTLTAAAGQFSRQARSKIEAIHLLQEWHFVHHEGEHLPLRRAKALIDAAFAEAGLR